MKPSNEQTNGYFDQMNEIVDSLADALSKLQLSTARINLFVHGGEPNADDEAPNAYSGGVPAMVLMNKLIDCVEQAEFVLDELNDAGNFLLGGDDDSEDWDNRKLVADERFAEVVVDDKALTAIEKAKEIKADTIMIGKHVVPAPIRSKPDLGRILFSVRNLDRDCDSNLYDAYTWSGSSLDWIRLENGLTHTSKSAAIAHAKALIAVSKGE